jgi:hypothetical protein
MSDQAPVAAPAPSPKTILMSLAGALIGAIALLFLFVLPAETGFDPLGTGRLLGLTGLANPPSAALTASATQGLRSDVFEVTLEPFQSVEYKYDLALGEGMTFSWSAEGGDVYYDMHAEPEGGPEGFAESFAIGTAARQDGVYLPSFPGIHGWFWENRGASTVTVRLEASGFMTGATVFERGGQSRREIPE